MEGFLVVSRSSRCSSWDFRSCSRSACLDRLHPRNGFPIDLIAQRTLYALDSFPLVAVPVFLFVGSLMNSAGISRYIYKFADTATGRLPGGLAQVKFSAVSCFPACRARRSRISAASAASRSTR